MNQVIIITRDNQRHIYSGKGIKVGFIVAKDVTQITVSTSTVQQSYEAVNVKKTIITNLKENCAFEWTDNKWKTKLLDAERI